MKRVFVSFDFDHDRVLKTFIIGQARLADSPFVISDYSLREEVPQASWEARARARISRADVFIVMLGPLTIRARGVLKEVAIASSLNKPRFQLIGYRNGTETWAVPNAGRTYRWNWETLKRLLR